MDKGGQDGSLPRWHRDSGVPRGGFGFKTAWIAVRDRDPAQVAEALELTQARPMDWVTGTDLAYKRGVYVAPRLGAWTLAHGDLFRTCLSPEHDELSPWLVQLSRALGEVQSFHTHRVSEAHQWAYAIDGDLRRAYATCGMTGEDHSIGEPTDAERAIGKGIRTMPEDVSEWTDEDWDAFNKTVPNELDVMKIAERWSIDPSAIRNEDVRGDGVYGELAPKTER